VVWYEKEWGSFLYSELADQKLPYGLSIERDRYCTMTYKDLQKL